MVLIPRVGVEASRPFLVSVEGNIGSGKSTLLNYLGDSFSDLVHTCPEPVAKWRECNGNNLLDMLYNDPKRYSFQFQSYVQLTRLQILLEPTPKAVKIIERSIQNNRYCFLKVAERIGSLSRQELHVLNAWHDWLQDSVNLDLDLIVYLRTDPKIAFERMKLRNRSEEAGAKLQYLTHVHDSYEDWLIRGKFGNAPAPVIVVDANKDIDHLKNVYASMADLFLGKRTDFEKPLHFINS